MKLANRVVILLNMACMFGAYVFTANFGWNIKQYLDIMFKVFDVYYVLEVASKLFVFVFLAENSSKYLRNKIFLLEVTIGIFHIVDLAVWKPVTATRVLRLFFVLRLLTLFESIEKFTKYIIQSLPALVLICCCFFTIFFGYSIIGMELFGGSETYRCRYPTLT